MIDVLYEKMAIPESCLLGKRVFKKLFHENAQLGATDKKALRDDIDTIVWQYTLKPTTIQIQAYEDDQGEYHEVAILQVNLRAIKRMNRIAEFVHRAIPYPLVVVFTYENSCALSAAHKRFSLGEKEAIVAEDFLTTDWIDLSGPTIVQRDFIDSLAVTALPQTHFFAFYSGFVDRLIALECARLTGKYTLKTGRKTAKTRRDRLAVCHELEERIAGLRADIKKETQFNRKVEFNTKIERLLKKLFRYGAKL